MYLNFQNKAQEEHSRMASADEEPSCTIIVSGVSCIDSIDTLEMYFETKKRSGGGEIVDLVRDERDVDIIYITFEDHEVVQRILSKSHNINDHELTVRLFEPTKPTAESEDSEEPGPVCTVVVKGASRVDNRDILEMYFESKKRSGGRDIEEMHTDDEDEDIVYISFTDESVAQEVAARSHTIRGETLEVSLYIPPVEVLEPAGPVKTICVRMVTPVPADILEMYFESKKRSGGGDVECVEIDQDDPCIAYVTFWEEEVAETVSTKTHAINGDNVEVSLYQPACSKQVPGCTIKVSGGVNQFKTTDPLEMYFANRKRSGGDDVVEIKRDPDNFDIVYVTFETNDVVTSVLKRSRHRVNEQTLRVEAYVPSQQPKKGTKQTTKDQKQKKAEEMEEEEKPVCSVRVTGVSKISSQDAVIYYFENNRRSGGGEINKSWKDEENPDLLFITYKSPEVAKAVSEKSSHSVDGKELKAFLYRPPKPLPTYTDSVLTKGLSPATTQDCLFNYLEDKFQAVPVKSVYGAIEETMAESKHYVEDQVHGRVETSARQEEQPGTCDVCQADDVTRSARGWCESCDELLCESCYMYHCRPRKMRDHQLCTIEEMKKRKQMVRLANKCKKHEGELLKYYCKGHRDLECSHCFISKHHMCAEIVCIADVQTSETEEFKTLEKLLSNLDEMLKSSEESVERNQALVARQHDQAVTDIEEAGEKLKTLIDKLVKKHIEKAEKFKGDNNRILTDNVTTNKVLNAKLNTGREMINAAKGDNNQLFITMKYLQSESALIKAKVDEMEKRSNIIDYEFEANSQLADVLEMVTELGSLRDKQKCNMEMGTDEVTDEVEVRRFKYKTQSDTMYYGDKTDAIQVSTDRDIRLTSVLLYPCVRSTTQVSLSVTEGSNSLIQCDSTHPKTDEEIIEVKLTKRSCDEGIILQSGHWYDIVVTIEGNWSCWGDNGQAAVTADGVKFYFRDSSQSDNYTGVSQGQFPGFRFTQL